MIDRVMIDPMMVRQPICPNVIYPIDVCPIDVRPIDGETALTSPQEFTPICPLCNEPVLLETCKADEQGRAVHEHCYALKLKFHKAPQLPLEP